MPGPQYNTIRDSWTHYLIVDMPPGAPEIQRNAMERAFYAGAASCILIAARAAIDLANGDLAVIEKLNIEMREFASRKKEQGGA